MACGMPLPRAPGAKRRVVQITSMKLSGVITGAASGQRAMKRACAWMAQSQPSAKATATSPTAMAPHQNTARVRHWRSKADRLRRAFHIRRGDCIGRILAPAAAQGVPRPGTFRRRAVHNARGRTAAWLGSADKQMVRMHAALMPPAGGHGY
jgi:hypothetical protein